MPINNYISPSSNIEIFVFYHFGSPLASCAHERFKKELTFFHRYATITYMKRMYLEGGCVRTAHGVRGLFKTDVWCDSPEVLAAQKRIFFAEKDGSYKEHTITSATRAGQTVILGIEGVQAREDAVALRGTVFYLCRDDMPLKKGSFFIVDLIGTPVIDADSGRVYGHIKSVDDVPQGQMFTVDTPYGDVLLPRVDAFVRSVDPDEGVLVTPIPGFFREEEDT